MRCLLVVTKVCPLDFQNMSGIPLFQEASLTLSLCFCVGHSFPSPKALVCLVSSWLGRGATGGQQTWEKPWFSLLWVGGVSSWTWVSSSPAGWSAEWRGAGWGQETDQQWVLLGCLSATPWLPSPHIKWQSNGDSQCRTRGQPAPT